tara:strand:- start:29 stop:466 length:438 start_codon:yes stop_codon:yes gene_type:complete
MYIYTAQLSKAKQLNISNVIDITVKSGHKIFAPTWDMVNGVKNKTLSSDEYTKMYYDMMRLSYKENITEWELILNKDDKIPIILGCYCKYNTFCHRLLLKDILLKCYPKSYYMGEVGYPESMDADACIKMVMEEHKGAWDTLAKM